MIDLFVIPKVTPPKPDYVHILEDDVVWDGACRSCGRRDVEFYGKSHACKACTKAYQRRRFAQQRLREGFGARASPEGLTESLLEVK